MSDGPTTVETAAGTAPVLTANALRALAEWMDGIRDGPASLVIRDGKYVVISEAPASGEKLVLQCDTRSAPKLSHSVDKVLVSAGGLTDIDASKYDAMFWSASSIEKFMLPYYFRFLDRLDFDDLVKRCGDSDVYAVAHEPKSDPDYMRASLKRSAQILAVGQTGFVPFI